jgi:uncharacterized protein (DUF2236 family)
MAFEVVLTSSVPPERVLDAIRENLREWRESKIPRDLWKNGVLQVVGKVEPPRFRMRLDRRWQRGEGDLLELVGEVVSDGNGGSRVIARVFLAIAALGDRGVSRDDRDAAYLAERLQEAVATATSRSSAPA